MDWNRFLVANAAGGIVWACAVGLAAYAFGRTVLEVAGPVGIALVIGSVAFIAAGFFFLRSHEAELETRAEQALPGPLRPVHHWLRRQAK
jgi:membrane protein DedA with SNARE-associated domain